MGEQAVLTRLMGNIAIHPSDIEIADVRKPMGKITGSKLVFLDCRLGIVVKMGKAGGDIWREIRAYLTLIEDPHLNQIREYVPNFLGYTCGRDYDAFALEDLKKKGYVELYDLFHAPAVTNQFKEKQCQAVAALSDIHWKTISTQVPNIADIYVKNRFRDSVEKARVRIAEHNSEPEFKILRTFVKSDGLRINGEKTLGIERTLKVALKNLEMLRPPHSVLGHGDSHLKNILANGKSIKFIDWVNSSSCQDPAYDLGKYIHFLIHFYPLQLLQDEEIGLKVNDLKLDYALGAHGPEMSYDIKAFVPRGVDELVRSVPNNHFLFSCKIHDRGAPGRLLLAVAAATIGGIKYLPPKLSLICLGESLKTLDRLHEVVQARKANDLDVCLKALTT